MSAPYARAPHVGDRHYEPAPQAALLIDFDNVTLGRGSDLTKELKTLLASEIIKSKVAVQRAYADWRRYPQYIVPLSEASIDLIFAPAYGSSKKNATDIRMAIDAIELVFVRPEIHTYILLTGDSDFSSVVLKLKEYGKYVIGVGIQESSSDILVQNCDEYYSYTSLTGLTKTSEATRVSFDPWVLVEEAVKKMTERRDVMRSDRLKQVMREIDKGFNENEHGFPKFSKFLAEASSRGLVKLRKMENGQYEVSAGKKRGRGRRGQTPQGSTREGTRAPSSGDPIQDAYAVLRGALEELSNGGRDSVRDSDVKRRILIHQPKFDEAELGFPKFSLFLKQAEEHQVVSLSRKQPEGYIEVRLLEQKATAPPAAEGAASTGSDPSTALVAKSGGVALTRGRRTRPRRGAAPEAPATRAPVADQDATAPQAKTAPQQRAVPDEQPQSTPSGSVGSAEASSQEQTSERRRDRDRSDRTRGSDRGRGGRRGRSTAGDAGEATGAGEDAPSKGAATESDAGEGDSQAELEWGSTGGDVQKVSAPDVSSESKASRAPQSRTLHPRQQTGHRGADGPPPFFEGQTVSTGSTKQGSAPSGSSSGASAEAAPAEQAPAPGTSGSSLFQGLPSEAGAIQRYLTHRYKGVGEKTAEQVVEAFGVDVFQVLDASPQRVTEVLSDHRAEALLEAWQADKARRTEGS